MQSQIRHIKAISAIFVFCLLLCSTNSNACSCPGISDYLTFYRETRNLFVGKVVGVSQARQYQKYELEVIDPLRGKFRKKEFIYIGRELGICPHVSLVVGLTYLLQVSRYKGELYISHTKKKLAKWKNVLDSTFNSRINIMQTKSLFFSDRKNPRTGGVILVRNVTRQELDKIIKQDPFIKTKLRITT